MSSREIRGYLDRHFTEPPRAEQRRANATKAKQEEPEEPRGGRMTLDWTKPPAASAIRICTSPVMFCGFVRMGSSARALKMCTWA